MKTFSSVWLLAVVACGLGLLLSSLPAAALDAATKCELSKLKTASKLGACRIKAESTAIKKGSGASFGKCTANFSKKWQKAESRGAGACVTSGDSSVISARVEQHTDDVATLLSGGSVAGCPATGLPASGQQTSYGSGDDGDLRPGRPLAYVDNGDGTITDLNTGLMWEKKIALGGSSVPCVDETGSCADPHDADNRYTWSATGIAYDGTVVTIFLDQLNNRCDADVSISCTTDADCAGVGGACGFAGHRDWRLPSIKELQSIVDYEVFGPAVDPAFHGTSCGPACTDLGDPACSCTASSLYWSSTTNAGYSTVAWFVGFGGGSVNVNVESGNNVVRAVRGGL